MSPANNAADLKQVVSMAVEETLIRLGLDVGDPIEIQKDMAFLRGVRTTAADVQHKSFLAVVTLCVAGLAGVLWAGIRLALQQTS